MAERLGTRITDAKLRTLPAGAETLFSSTVRGLHYTPSKRTKATGTWFVRFYADGVRKRIKLGAYPALGLAEAEAQAKEVLAQAKSGVDPKQAAEIQRITEEAERRKTLADAQHTFEVAARRVYQDKIDSNAWKNARYREQWLTALERLIFPKFGQFPLREINVATIRAAVQPIAKTTPAMADKVLNYVSAVFAEHFEELDGYNPVPHARKKIAFKPVDETQRHFPSMPFAEVPHFFKNVLLSGKMTASKQALVFTILNASRSGAARLMCWPELDLENAIWTMPAHGELRKTAVNRRYPLATQCLALLHERRGNDNGTGVVFPSNKCTRVSGWCLSDMSMTKLIRDNHQNYTSDIRCEPSEDNGQRTTRVPVVHGFRATFAAWAMQQGYDDVITEIQLAHEVGDKVRRAYKRDDLLERRREMVQAWADYCYSEIQ